MMFYTFTWVEYGHENGWVIEIKTKQRLDRGVINDPLSQLTHTTARFVKLDFEKYVRTSRVNIVITTGRVWVGLVDQYGYLSMQ